MKEEDKNEQKQDNQITDISSKDAKLMIKKKQSEVFLKHIAILKSI